ncbi:MAG TPA: LysR family transcriptional regulator [Noviherbaspirillum sp.]|uniref:LysR family transcriptional regulator n=1 Tax=Noviherbaspirillum sp. TaxID=1926288 RepID=UPI002D390AEF|nr:LysR family transcriptional regulator [Noviherbaspirillum sp.]HYD96564.1 LysR family transcriptional regulator [Noviherbaspirillum sp.]
MIVDAQDLVLFACVAETESFTEAAERLGMPKSTLSRRLSELETRLGERLLVRTTRRLTVTDFGRLVMAHGQSIAAEAEAASVLAQSRQTRPTGRLRVTMPSDFANLLLASFLTRFSAQHPGITLELDLSPRIIDLVAEGYDLAIRMGELADDAMLVARPLVRLSTALYASPAYVARKGLPATPEALQAHDGVHLHAHGSDAAAWELRRGAERVKCAPGVRVLINSPELILRMTLEGAGIAPIDDYMAQPHLASGRLVRVLPKWSLAPVQAWVVTPGRKLLPSRTRAFMLALEAEFAARR